MFIQHYSKNSIQSLTRCHGGFLEMLKIFTTAFLLEIIIGTQNCLFQVL